MKIQLTLRYKILLATIGLVAGSTTISLFVINVQLRSQIQEKTLEEFESVRHSFKNFLYVRGQQLIESSLLIAKYPSFVDPVIRKDNQNVRIVIIELMNSLRADLLVVTDEKGEVLGRFQSTIYGDNIDHLSAVRHALEGGEVDSVDVWEESGELYVVATAFVLIPGRNFIAGTISLGQKLLDHDAQDLARATGTQVSFVFDNNIIASSGGEEFKNELIKVYINKKEEIEATAQRGESFSEEAPLAGEEYFTTYGPVVPGRPGVYAISISLEPRLKALREVQQVIFFVGLTGILIALVIAYLVSKNITSPLSKLALATRRVRDGHFDFQVAVDSGDEIGALAESFNSMVDGLRERLFMEKFVSSSTLEMIHRARDGNLMLGGERKVVTVFFSDIRGFTAYSERVPPEEVVEMLNKYLSVQATIIRQYNGIIDKFVGDEIVAIFQDEDMVDRAVQSAMEISVKIHQLSEQFPEDIKVGIGINTGMVVVGNVGSEERMDHTVLGSNVNLGSRLCSMAKPGQVVLSESSFRLMKIKVQTRPLEAIQVKGINLPVQTFEVVFDPRGEPRSGGPSIIPGKGKG